MKETTKNQVLLMGNEALARGILEGGASFVAGYPGNPSSEIIATLLQTAADLPVHVEWSTNEMVAAEAAAGASFAGLRAAAVMKENGVNVCADFLATLAVTGVRGGYVVVVCDDPGPLTSSNEGDARLLAQALEIPIMEASTPQEAKDMTRWAFQVSEERSTPVMVRSVSRLSHGRAGVELGVIPEPSRSAEFDTEHPLLCLPSVAAISHPLAHDRLRAVQKDFEDSIFNDYEGSDAPELLVISSGLSVLYAREAVSTLGMEDRVGIAKIGTVWPLPEGRLGDVLRRSKRILVVEQIEPFLEEKVRARHSDLAGELGDRDIYGRRSGHIPETGDISANTVADALAAIMGGGRRLNATFAEAASEIKEDLPLRDISFCRGCPHRASFWAIRTALELDGRNGFVAGDIGCYGLAAGPTGYQQIKVVHCMGSGIGNASGFGVLRDMGMEQPVVAVAGDSTFFASCLPGLINAINNGADVVFVVLDNSVTAMTGFQSHPGSSFGPRGEPQEPLRPETVCRALGVETSVYDPVADVKRVSEAVYDRLQRPGVQALVLRRTCSTYEDRMRMGSSAVAQVDQEICVGETCGCDRFCTRVVGCPGNRWDAEKGKAYIDPDFCNGCGLCVELCSWDAISLTEGGE